MRYAGMDNCNFSDSDLRTAHIEMSSIRSAEFIDTEADDAVIKGDLSHSKFYNARFNGAKFSGSTFYKTTFNLVELNGADLTNCSLHTTTRFESVSTNGCQVDRVGFRSLSDDRGGLTHANRDAMKVVDDQAELRIQFHGIARLVAWGSMLFFLGPYAWFAIERLIHARFLEDSGKSPSMPLWEAISRFIVTGGVEWQRSWALHFSFILFLLFCVYHAVRITLMMKAAELDARDIVTGTPPHFRLYKDRHAKWYSPSRYTRWGLMFWFVRWGAIGMYVAGGINTIHFMRTPVPLS